MAVEPPQGCIPAPYHRRHPEKTVLYGVVQAHFETYLCQCNEGTWDGSAVPAHVEREFRRYLDCGILARGLLVPPWDSPPSLGAYAKIRSRRIFARQGYLDKDEAKDMAEWVRPDLRSSGPSQQVERPDRMSGPGPV